MTDFDIRAAIFEVVYTSGISDPREISAKIGGEVPDPDLRRLFIYVLPAFVRHVLHDYRRVLPPAQSAASPEQHRPVPGYSARVAAHQADAERRRWERLLRAPVSVEGNLWKPFGKCTIDEVEFLSADRAAKEAENAGQKRRYNRYVADMARLGAVLVEDLSDDQIDSIEGQS